MENGELRRKRQCTISSHTPKRDESAPKEKIYAILFLLITSEELYDFSSGRFCNVLKAKYSAAILKSRAPHDQHTDVATRKQC